MYARGMTVARQLTKRMKQKLQAENCQHKRYIHDKRLHSPLHNYTLFSSVPF